jgi:O-methyltransferase
MALSFEERECRKALLKAEGYGVIPNDQYRIDMEDSFRELWKRVEACTMTGMERGYGLYQAVKYLEKRNIPGEFVECGVWKGGSCMLMMGTLLELGRLQRTIRLYDTFCGMPEPGDEDIVAWNRRPVREKWESDGLASWAVGLDEVLANLGTFDYPPEKIKTIPGDVAETLVTDKPESIALLRLDTDWYASTLLELEILYPLLVPGGVLVIDDYGHFEGARKAVDEYFTRPDIEPILLSRMDYTGRMGVKC